MIFVPPIFKVDFRKDPENRWNSLLRNAWARRKARELCRAALQPLKSKLGIFADSTISMLAFGARLVATSSLGEVDYMDDVAIWSEFAVGDRNTTLLANLSYEMHQSCKVFSEAIPGLSCTHGWCTSVAFYQPGIGMVHCRNLDWPLFQMKRATVILDCKSWAGPFRAVAVPGMVGILSGVARGRFSVTINSKEDSDSLLPNLKGWGGPFLLRWLLENCTSYREALQVLKSAPAFVPFFVMITGPLKGQSAVIEVNVDGNNRFYEQDNIPVAVANHYPGVENPACDTQKRQNLAERMALRCKAKALRACFSVVNKYPVMAGATVQSMVFHPASGAVLLQRV